jgi:3-isopropylmalate/(R)-2-methylmalate dehydratase large subunit
MPSPQTLFEKIWKSHVVFQEPDVELDCPAVLYIDLHLIHEVTSPQAFQGLRDRGIGVRRPDLTVATIDHIIPTTGRSLPGFRILDPQASRMVSELVQNCRDWNIELHDLASLHQGIVHVIGPELGLTQPGKTVVCGDSHTSTHGAFGALAFGIGTSEVEHVLATQCLLQTRPKTMEIRLNGRLQPGVSAKDIILAVIARIGVGGGTGHVFEYTGSAIRALSMEQRMTVCNMSIEGGARAGMIAPDDTTFQYLHGRTHSPKEAAWDEAVAKWRALPTDEGATYDSLVELDASRIEPMITYGTNPGMAIAVTAPVPDPAGITDAGQRGALSKALEYMALPPGRSMLGHPVDVVFIGSCTNSRIADLRDAASVLRGRKVHPGTRVLIVPGSAEIGKMAEAEGLADIFRAAGAEWREAGCSMCIAMNGDELTPGQYCVSTSNRNFEGRQGKGGRTLLASPLTAAACAVTGVVSDVRTMLEAA